MAAPLARDASLKAHIALAAMRQGQGNVALLGELMKTVYLTYLLSAGNRPDLAEGFAAGQQALNDNFATGSNNGEWVLDAVVATALEPILLEHDAQLARRPLHVIEAHQDRLTKMLRDERFPNLAKTAAVTSSDMAREAIGEESTEETTEDVKAESEAEAFA